MADLQSGHDPRKGGADDRHGFLIAQLEQLSQLGFGIAEIAPSAGYLIAGCQLLGKKTFRLLQFAAGVIHRGLGLLVIRASLRGGVEFKEFLIHRDPFSESDQQAVDRTGPR